jgi:hypothetical protein
MAIDKTPMARANMQAVPTDNDTTMVVRVMIF